MLKEKIQIDLLGGLSARVNERVITKFRTQKTGVLLAYLAYEPEKLHPREELIEMLWGECEPLRGRNSLSQALSSLRRQLEPPGVESGAVLKADRYNVGLNPDAVRTDVSFFLAEHRKFENASSETERARAFDALRSAYAGELLPGFYEEWCISERDRLQLTYLEALRTRSIDLEKAGHTDAAIEISTQAVNADPLDEDLQFLLIRLLTAAGQRAKAFDQFRLLSDLLEEELGLTPSEEISEFIESIRSGEGITEGRIHGNIERRSAPRVSMGQVSVVSDGLVAILAVEGDLTDRTELLKKGIDDRHRKMEVDDGISCLTFSKASDALEAGLGLQELFDKRAAADPDFNPPRMALSIGEIAESAPGGYGALQTRTRSLIGSANQGQFICSEAAASLVRRHARPGVDIRELGVYRLHSEDRSSRLYQIDSSERTITEFGRLEAEPIRNARVPIPLSRFFGRERESRTICDWMHPAKGKARLVTLTGPGGTGKTRLSLVIAEKLRAAFHDRVFFAALASVENPQLIPGAILESLGEEPSSTSDPVDQAIKALREKRSLLILDNLEHLLLLEADTESRPTREIIEKVLRNVPELHLLITSRNSVNIFGEKEFFVEPLPVPAEGFSSEQIRESESVKLFVDRAQTIRPTFQLTDSTTATVGRICGRLEGIPLAIELAAGQVQVLTLSRLERGLAKRFDVLTDQKRQPERRHQHLRGTIDWSFDLLPENVRSFFCALTVFRDGADVSDVETVVDDPLALDHLAFLEEASFVRISENLASNDMRFSMLETLREYGREKIDPENLGELRDSHAERYLALAEEASAGLKGGDQSSWLKRLEADQSNLRAAIDHFLGSDNIGFAARMATALEAYWMTRGLAAEGISYLSQLFGSVSDDGLSEGLKLRVHLALGDLLIERSDFEDSEFHFENARVIADERADLKSLAEAFNGIGRAVFEQGDYARAYPYQERSLELWNQVGDDYGASAALNNLGLIASERGDYPTALRHYNESLRKRRKIGDKRGIATQLNNIGIVSRRTGDYEAAREAYEESLALRKELGDIRNVASSLSNLSWVAENLLEFNRAEKLQLEALKIRRELDDEWGIALSKNVLAILARHQNRTEEAHTLFEESLSIRRRIGNKLGLGETLFYLGDLLTALGKLDAAEERLNEALEVMYEIKNKLGIANTLESCSKLALAKNDLERSAILMFSARRLRNEIGARLTPSEEKALSEHLRTLQELMKPGSFEKAKKHGLSLSFQNARKLAVA